MAVATSVSFAVMDCNKVVQFEVNVLYRNPAYLMRATAEVEDLSNGYSCMDIDQNTLISYLSSSVT